VDVGEDDGVVTLGGPLQPLDTVLGDLRAKPDRLELGADHPPVHRVVLDQEDDPALALGLLGGLRRGTG
jgi:hypothetical protein